MTIWFNKVLQTTGLKYYNSKSISLMFMPQHFLKLRCDSNGAIKGIDKCYDLNINLLGVIFSYTNWDYNR